MFDLEDIPASWYVRIAVAAVRLSRKKDFLRNVVWNAKDRVLLGPLTRLHLGPIHDIRRFKIDKKSLSESKFTYSYLELLATNCRDVMAEVAEISPSDIHCTIKLCSGPTNATKEQMMVYTIARSTPCHRPAEFGRSHSHRVGNNSAFASLVGCSDQHNQWQPHAYTCFACGDLRKHSNYDCSRKEWSSFWRSTCVFPLRYRMADDSHHVFGFLTFDSLRVGAFRGMPNIFEYHNRGDSEDSPKLEYDRLLAFRSAYHLGGILADTLAIAFYPMVRRKDQKQ